MLTRRSALALAAISALPVTAETRTVPWVPRLYVPVGPEDWAPSRETIELKTTPVDRKVLAAYETVRDEALRLGLDLGSGGSCRVEAELIAADWGIWPAKSPLVAPIPLDLEAGLPHTEYKRVLAQKLVSIRTRDHLSSWFNQASVEVVSVEMVNDPEKYTDMLYDGMTLTEVYQAMQDRCDRELRYIQIGYNYDTLGG